MSTSNQYNNADVDEYQSDMDAIANDPTMTMDAKLDAMEARAVEEQDESTVDLVTYLDVPAEFGNVADYESAVSDDTF